MDKRRVARVELICPECGTEFKKMPGDMPKDDRPVYCSHQCRVSANRSYLGGGIKAYVDGVRVQSHRFDNKRRLRDFMEFYFDEYGATCEILISFDDLKE